MVNISLITNIININDPVYLTSLITEDLILNYEKYITTDIITSSNDYTTLASKSAYDLYITSKTSSVSGNIRTDVIKTKSIITYVSQEDPCSYNCDEYRWISEDNETNASKNATSTVFPKRFTKNVSDIIDTFKIHVLKTTNVVSFVATKAIDFLDMPIIFASTNLPVLPNTNDNHYSLKSMLLAYYTRDYLDEESTTDIVLISGAVGFGLLTFWCLSMEKFKSRIVFSIAYVLSVFILGFGPIFLEYLVSPPKSTNIVEVLGYLNRSKTLNRYQAVGHTILVILGLIMCGYTIVI